MWPRGQISVSRVRPASTYQSSLSGRIHRCPPVPRSHSLRCSPKSEVWYLAVLSSCKLHHDVWLQALLFSIIPSQYRRHWAKRWLGLEICQVLASMKQLIPRSTSHLGWHRWKYWHMGFPKAWQVVVQTTRVTLGIKGQLTFLNRARINLC